MPVYEYRASGKGCGRCTNGFEVRQSMSDAALEKCPACGRPVARVIQKVGVLHKTSDLMSPSNLRSKGFRKFVKSSAAGGYREET